MSESETSQSKENLYDPSEAEMIDVLWTIAKSSRVLKSARGSETMAYTGTEKKACIEVIAKIKQVGAYAKGTSGEHLGDDLSKQLKEIAAAMKKEPPRKGPLGIADSA